MEGREIPLGHNIGVVQNGERKTLWKDGENGFSLAKNRHTLATYRRILEMADVVTCSTQGVADALQKEVTPRRIRVFPNLVRMDWYEQVDLREDPDKVKILWQGGIAHYEDWYPLREALGNITRKYPQVEWIIWGAQFPWVKELIPAHRMKFKPWCAYQEYRLRLAMIGHDISLAPLSSNVFNDCRSAIKFYEGSVLKKPAATLAQNTGAYQKEIVDGETGLLFNTPEEFENKLSLLIEDVTERKRLAANAKDWISENRDAMKRVPEMVAYWEQVREEKKREQPHPSDEHWKEIEAEAEAEEAQMNGEPVQPVQPVPA
jgi:glycosyltransferase involved in cell wall biosynthesis